MNGRLNILAAKLEADGEYVRCSLVTRAAECIEQMAREIGGHYATGHSDKPWQEYVPDEYRDLVERESPHEDDCRLGEFTRSVDAAGNAETYPCTCNTGDDDEC